MVCIYTQASTHWVLSSSSSALHASAAPVTSNSEMALFPMEAHTAMSSRWSNLPANTALAEAKERPLVEWTRSWYEGSFLSHGTWVSKS